MFEKILSNIEEASKKLEKLNENYHFLCKEARENIDNLCHLHINIEQMITEGATSVKKGFGELMLFFHLVDTECALVFEPIE